MSTGDPIRFGPFRFDPEQCTLRRDDTPVPLRPRAALVLKFLLDHAGRLLTRQEILHGVWRGGHVTNNALRVCIHEIRQALEDPSEQPRYLKTEGRDGYRFIGRLAGAPTGGGANLMVGRQRELNALDTCLHRARQGHRQLALIHGEAGAGKTTLLNHFLADVQGNHDVIVLRGQGIETSGRGEALQPLLDCLEALSRLEDRPQLARLRRHAPGWCSLLPHLPGDASPPATPAFNNPRLGRELSCLLEAVGEEAPVLLVLEDLHWSDSATLAALNTLLQRTAPARLLVLGSLRPALPEALQGDLAMLRGRLRAPDSGVELTVAPFSREEMAEYARRRLGDRVAAPLLELLWQRTQGHPLFTSDLLDFLLDGGLLRHTPEGWSWESGGDGHDLLPGRTRQLVEVQLERLPTLQQHLLEVASVVGMCFSCELPAACLALPVETVEQHCAHLVRYHRLLEECEPQILDDRDPCGIFRFRHDIYRQLCYQRLSRIRRLRLHRQVAQWLESRQDHTAPVASAGELAHHHSQAGDWRRAAHYRRLAAEAALGRAAPREVIFHCQHGLDSLRRLPDPASAAAEELSLLVTMIIARTQLEGHASRAVAPLLERAAGLTLRTGSAWQQARVLWGRYVFHTAGDPDGAAPALKRLLGFVRERREAVLDMVAHHALGGYLFYQRTRLDWALRAFDTALSLYDPRRDRDMPLRFGQDTRVLCLGNSAWINTLLGDFHRAEQCYRSAQAHAEHIQHPYSLLMAWLFTLNACVEMNDPRAVETAIETVARVADQHGFEFCQPICQSARIWLEARQRGKADWRTALTLLEHKRRGGSQIVQVGWWQAIDTLFAAGRLDACQRELDRFIQWSLESGQSLYLAEGYRRQGELMLRRRAPDIAAAARSFQCALRLARRQRNRLFELRAALGLAELWRDQGGHDEAYRLLTGVLAHFGDEARHPTLDRIQQLLNTLDDLPLAASSR